MYADSKEENGRQQGEKRDLVPSKKGASRLVNGFGLPPALMWSAVLINAGGRAYYRGRPPESQFLPA
jgi:hypothetical protein